MKTLILIQGTYDEKYVDTEQTVRETWFKDISSSNITAKFYYGAYDRQGEILPQTKVAIQKEQVLENENGEIIVGTYDLCSGDYFDPRGEKLIRVLEYVLNNYEFDYLLRVCNTSYIRIDKLEEYTSTIPRTHFHDGARNMYDSKYYFVSGHNSIMSRDCVEQLVNIKEEFLQSRYLEDLAVGYFLMHKLNYTSFIEGEFIPTHVFAFDSQFNPKAFYNHRAYNYRFRANISEKMSEYHNFLVNHN